jgi:uncharacterized repeat protein (TIGR01451 family)
MRRFRLRSLAPALLAVSLCVRPSAALAITNFLSENFTGTATPETVIYGNYGTGNNVYPCLTAATVGSNGGSTLPGCPTASGYNGGGTSGTLPDAPGSGALRMTNDSTNTASFVIFNTPVSAALGVIATFDYYGYDGSGADGLGFLIIDGSQTPTTVGGDGGSLGYAPNTTQNLAGIVGGYVGIGLDEYGNYSNPTEGRVGGPGVRAESVAVRGAAGTNWQYATGSQAGFGAGLRLDYPTATTRTAAVARNVRVTLTPSGYLTVDIDFTGTSKNYTNVVPSFAITGIAGQPKVPASLKFGFASSTGSETNYHEVRNFVARSLAPTLSITKAHVASPFVGLKTGQYTLAVANATQAGPAQNAVTVTDQLPTGESFNAASGTNWTCAAAPATFATAAPMVSQTASPQQTVTCSYGALPIVYGTTTQPLTVTVNVGANVPATVVNTATVNTVDNSDGPQTASDTVAGVPEPALQLVKRILSIVTTGPTPGPTTTPLTIVPTPDPQSAAGILGTASYPAVYPGDRIEYGLYFLNAGGATAIAPTATSLTTGPGPTFGDVLSGSLTYAGQFAQTCCFDPATAGTLAASTSGQTVTVGLSSPLKPYAAAAGNVYEGAFSFLTTVR